jgi:hypothetical protein
MKCLFCVCGTKMLQFNLQDPERVLTVRPQTCQDLDCANAAYEHHISIENTGNPFIHSSLNYSKLFAVRREPESESETVCTQKEWSEYLHCNENPIYVFPEEELRGLSPNYIHVCL